MHRTLTPGGMANAVTVCGRATWIRTWGRKRAAPNCALPAFGAVMTAMTLRWTHRVRWARKCWESGRQPLPRYLAPHIVPGRFALSLVCDFRHGEVRLPKLVLDGVRLLPRLKDCHVRLCETRDSHLQHIAQETVLQARGIASSEPMTTPSLFNRPHLLNLPREVRFRVLEYTDLVAPSKEVMWNRRASGSGYYIERAPCHNPDGPGFCLPECGRECEFSYCWQKPRFQPSIGCFCSRRHTDGLFIPM